MQIDDERVEPSLRTSRASRLLLTATAALGLLACVTRWTRALNDAPPQGWWAERGPVVPHDSFPADCRLCHAGDDWQTIREDFAFDHAAETGHPLEGAHAAAECLRCHNDRGPVTLFAQRGCAGCHADVHRGKLGQDCALCHGQSSWEPSEQIAQHNRTRFPLVGSHAAVACWRCHPGAEVGNFSPTDTNCESCHAADLARATNPDHLAAGLTTGCERCHLPTTWTGSGFTHPTFALTGAHKSADCSECHVGGLFGGTPSDCYSCHMAEYNGVSDPNHVTGNFPLTCESCHGTSTWSGAVFKHTGITANCQDCHLDDYQATSDPNHVTAGFPVSCELCHTSTNNWSAAAFNHAFPITTGKHKNLDCADCHTMPQNYALFSCIDCHEHSQSRMDDKHDEVSGYVWESSACYGCHPAGKE